MSKELGQRSDLELEALFGNLYSGWDRGVNVTQERFGDGETRFTETPMTPLELAARYVAAEIGVNIYEIANRAAFAPITVFSQIQARIGPLFDEAATALKAKETEMAALKESLREHHNWHLQAGTIGLQDGDDGWIEIDTAAEYSDSTMYEHTEKLLAGAPPQELQHIPRGGMNTWWWEQAVLLRRKVREAKARAAAAERERDAAREAIAHLSSFSISDELAKTGKLSDVCKAWVERKKSAARAVIEE